MKKLLFFCLPIIGFAQPTISVDVDQEAQTIAGFGAFGGIKAYWLPPPFHTEAFIDYFLDDMGSTIVRTNIFWDLEPTNDNASPYDLDLSKFNYQAGSNLANQLPYYKALKDAGLKKLVATSWTPPVWMKLLDDPDRIPDECYNCNNCPVGDPNRRVCGGRLNPLYYQEFAEYLIAYVRILKQEIDVDLYAINIQNEPYFANPFEANVVLPDEFADILRIVGQRFRQEGLSTKIFGPEHMAEWSWGVQQNYVLQVLEDATVAPYLDIYAVHSYVDGVAPDYGSAEGWSALRQNITVNHGKPLWMTETSGYPQTFEGAMNLAKSIYLALRFGNVSSWVYWGISGDPGSEFALMANGIPTPLYYASKQFYKFVTPGSIRVQAVSTDNEVLPLAFKNPRDGSMSVVLINADSQEKEFSLSLPVGPSSFDLYRTSAAEDCSFIGAVNGTVTLPPLSISTLVGFGSAGPSIDEIPNYFLQAGSSETLTIPLSGISAGASGPVDITVTSSNPAIVASPELVYSYPSATGTLNVNPNTSGPGKTTITLRLTNGNPGSPAGFSFNEATITFDIEVVDVVTGIKKKENDEISIYPNPAESSDLIITLGQQDRYRVEVVDGRGQTLFQALDASGSLHVSTRGWAMGMYVVTVTGTGDFRRTEKIIIP
jgi:O-glycosyl hydrolase